MAARGVIKAVGKALDFPYAEMDSVGKNGAAKMELNITIDVPCRSTRNSTASMMGMVCTN